MPTSRDSAFNQDSSATPSSESLSTCWCKAWQLVEELTGDPHVAVRTVLATERSHYGLLGHLVANSADFGTGLQRVIHYQPIWGDGARLEMRQDQATVELRHVYVDAKHATSRHMNVLVLPTFVRLARELAEGDFPIDAAGFYHSKPPSSEIYGKLYPCPIEFDAPCNYLRFPSRNLSAPLGGKPTEVRSAVQGFRGNMNQNLVRLSLHHRSTHWDAMAYELDD